MYSIKAISLLLFLPSIRICAGFCPLGCLCSDNEPSSPSVDCDGADLDSMPIFFNPRIRSLILSNNRISSVTLDELGIYTELEVLDLSNNDIFNIERGAFYRLQKLKALRLNSNQLATLGVETFSGLNELRALDLSENSLNRLATSIFSDLRRLETLNVSKNSIAHLSPGAFTGLTALKELHIQHNELKTVPKVALHAPQSLKVLDLSYNRLDAIPDEGFLHLRQLETLNLAGNGIESVEERAFAGLKSLRHLYLDTNRLHRVPTISFRPLTELNTLSISENLIDELTTSAFEGLARLRHLTISRCSQLKSIALNAFSGLFLLEVLILSDNRALTSIHPMSFELLQRSRITNTKLQTSLRQLYIFGNNFTSLPYSLLPWRQLDELDLRFNPWSCDCEFGWIGRALRRVYGKRGSYPDGAVCENPDSLRRRHLHTIRAYPIAEEMDEYDWADLAGGGVDLAYCRSPWSTNTMNLITSILPVIGCLFVITVCIWLCIQCRRRISEQCACCCCCFESGSKSSRKPPPPGLQELFSKNIPGEPSGHHFFPTAYTSINEPEGLYAGKMEDCFGSVCSRGYIPPSWNWKDSANYGRQPYAYSDYVTAGDEIQSFLPRTVTAKSGSHLGKLYANTSDYYSGVNSDASHSSPDSALSLSQNSPFGREGSFRVIQRYPIPITEL